MFEERWIEALLNIMAKVLGPYAATLTFASFQRNEIKRGGEATPDPVLLSGARPVRASEPEMGTQIWET